MKDLNTNANKTLSNNIAGSRVNIGQLCSVYYRAGGFNQQIIFKHIFIYTWIRYVFSLSCKPKQWKCPLKFTEKPPLEVLSVGFFGFINPLYLCLWHFPLIVNSWNVGTRWPCSLVSSEGLGITIQQKLLC